MKNTDINSDPFDLNRFVVAQENVYSRALAELGRGKKTTHWMWFIFPQIEGLGDCPTSKRFAISGAKETEAYLQHPILGARLLECAETVLDIEGRTASAIFGYPDDIKLRSSMTLFASVPGSESVFSDVLDKFFNGHRDEKTLKLLERL